MAKRAGMDFVTLTDHETIEGALTLTRHADFFVGEEVSACLPEEGGYVDVLVYGIDDEVHREAQARRHNAHGSSPSCGRPGSSTCWPTRCTRCRGRSTATVEKRLVMFGLWEFVNGSRPAQQNRLAREIARAVGAIELRQMAARQGLPVPPHRAISGTGGSDDHGGVYGGATHTWSRGREPGELLEAMAAGEVGPAGEDGSVGKMIHTGFKLAGAAIEEGEDGTAVRVLRGLALRPAFLRRSRAVAIAARRGSC